MKKEWEKLDPDGCERLVVAIIERAMDDYKLALKHLRRDRNDSSARHMIGSVRSFFRSQHYALLCDVPGDLILQELEKGIDINL